MQSENLVIEALSDALSPQLNAGHEIVAYIAGRMKKNRIKTLAGDRGDHRNVPIRSGED